MTEPGKDESGIAILRNAGGAVAFGVGLLLVAAGLLLVVLGLSGAPTVVGSGLPPIIFGALAVIVGIVTGAAGLVALYRRLTRR